MKKTSNNDDYHHCEEKCKWIATTQCSEKQETDEKSMMKMSVKPSKLYYSFDQKQSLGWVIPLIHSCD